MKNIAPRVTDEEKLARIKKVFPDDAEAKAILAWDKAVEATEKEELEFDLSPEKRKIAQKYTRTGTREVKQKPHGYKFSKKERKPNATKGGIIAELARFLSENSDFAVENLEIINKERQITFDIGADKFDLTLVQKRKPKK